MSDVYMYVKMQESACVRACGRACVRALVLGVSLKRKKDEAHSVEKR